MEDPSLEGAYALKSVEDTKRLYADWAETYDTGFAVEMDFVLPQRVAEAFIAAGGEGPVLDFGCGTGLVGDHLAPAGIHPIDGADLSEEMLAVAGRKGHYRDLVSGNVLDGYQMAGAPYQGVVSSGTFTNGHVGPEAIGILLDLAKTGALFALSINGKHFEDAGFAQALGDLGDRITELSLPEVRYYGPKATGPHKDDTGFIATFRKA